MITSKYWKYIDGALNINTSFTKSESRFLPLSYIALCLQSFCCMSLNLCLPELCHGNLSLCLCVPSKGFCSVFIGQQRKHFTEEGWILHWKLEQNFTKDEILLAQTDPGNEQKLLTISNFCFQCLW